MNPIELEMLEGREQRKPLALNLLPMALEALGNRALVWLVTMAAGGLWAYVAMEPDVLRIVSASLFCLTVLFPILYRDGRA